MDSGTSYEQQVHERAGVCIELFTPSLRVATSRMLARAFVRNPLHVAAFGAGQLAKNEAFFRTGLDVMKGTKRVAREADRIVGFVHWVQSPWCQFTAIEKARMLPSMIRGLGVGGASNASRWLFQWSRHDPAEPHLHLGPIGVDPDVQGRHVGSQLMRQFCAALEEQSLNGYLETDRPQNVAFYKRFGFEVVAERPVLGVKNFFMVRKKQLG